MVYEIKVKNKNNNMNCFIYKTSELDKLILTLQNLSYLDTNKYDIEIKNIEEEKINEKL